LIVLAAAGPSFADDPLDRRSTDWRGVDWQALAPDERHWVVIGFALAWRGPAQARGAAPRPAVTAARRAALTKASTGPDGRLAVLLLAAERDDPLPPLAVTGETWVALDSRARLALLHGFYAGVYAAALAEALEGTRDPARLEAGFAEARRLVRPRLALAPSLLFARLSDWLFYTDRRPAPLVETIAIIAAQIKGG
jgi:hypothetical protein